eukprot:CAMPEP_0117439750 /NCGR_PEP_ID=MMETSP0759-20121206/2724_1 /TAXON_ID=63605 /ORGANISM="Percolomonas cosmopolitus, Strain WS" /LENGTH=547 /DNA_ID=CAMNT_0005231471 /DNA_START=446 /DNA_END=2089 /DNA_ORIENTATION=+
MQFDQSGFPQPVLPTLLLPAASDIEEAHPLHCTFITLYRCRCLAEEQANEQSQQRRRQASAHTAVHTFRTNSRGAAASTTTSTTSSISSQSFMQHDLQQSMLSTSEYPSVSLLYNLLIMISREYFQICLPRVKDQNMVRYDMGPDERHALLKEIEKYCVIEMERGNWRFVEDDLFQNRMEDTDANECITTSVTITASEEHSMVSHAGHHNDNDQMDIDQEHSAKSARRMQTVSPAASINPTLPNHQNHQNSPSQAYKVFSTHTNLSPKEILANCLYYAARLLPLLTGHSETEHTTSTTEFLENPHNFSIESLFKTSADLGRVEAMHRYAWLSLTHDDLSTAVQYYRKAIALKHVPSMVNLGYLYERQSLPDDSVHNPDESHDILTQQSHSFFDQCANRISPLYMKMALYYYYLAALEGSVMGWCNMGTAFKSVFLYTESVQCFYHATQMNYSPAFVCLGRMFETGRGVTQSPEEALKCYMRAAQQGNVDALVNIGLMMQSGEGTRQSLSQALSLFEQAVLLGDHDAEKYVRNVKRKIVKNCTCIGHF